MKQTWLLDPASYRGPVVFSVGIHLLVLVVFSVSYVVEDKSVLVKPREIKYIKAVVVPKKPSAKQLKAQREQAARKKKEKERIKEIRRKEEQKKAEAQKRIVAKKTKDKKQKEEKEKKKRLDQKQAEKEKLRRETLEKQRQARAEHARKLKEKRKQQSLERQKAAELAQRADDEKAIEQARLDAQQVSDNVIVGEYVGLIQQQIESAWQKPLSAQNGMQTTLQIHLIPGGEVTDVNVVKSSGNDVFDRSATQAAWKASPLAVPKETGVFSRKFRVVELLFKPEDL